jgi:hypothetical protein
VLLIAAIVSQELSEYIERFGRRRFNLGCLISLKSKFVYFRVPKVANSTIKLYLNKHESQGAGRKFRMRMAHDLYYGSLLRPYQIGWENPLLEEILTSDEYLRVGFVRNPYSRILSAYLDRYCRRLDRQPDGAARLSNFLKTVCAKAVKMGFPEDHRLSFGEFVKVVCSMEPHNIDTHLAFQWEELHSPLIDLGFIGYFEFFRRDFRTLIRKLYGDQANLQLKNKSPSKQQANKRLLDFYDDESLKLITERYRRDFELYGYPIVTDISKLCDENLVSTKCKG